MSRIEEYPNLNIAFGEAVDIIRSTWVLLAQEHSATGAYVRGLFEHDSLQFPFGDELEVAVVNVSPHAAFVEYGHGGFHLPSQVKNWAHRITKGPRAGVGYVRVPFRHFTPGNTSASGRAKRGTMPKDIYDVARHGAVRGLGDQYKQSKSYVYYKARFPNFPANLLSKARRQEGQPGYTWRASKYEGMVRNAQVTEKADQGVYSTFRTMTQDSAGWYIPAQPGQHLARRVAEEAGPIVGQMLSQAATKDAMDTIVATLTAGGLQVEVG